MTEDEEAEDCPAHEAGHLVPGLDLPPTGYLPDGSYRAPEDTP